MLVLVNGMPRSGSTFAFNIAREILTRRGSATWSASDQIETAVLGSTAESIIVKSHNPSVLGMRLVQSGAMKAICTIRDPVEAIESWMEVFGFDIEQSIMVFQAWFRSYISLQKYCLVIRHSEIERNRMYVIWKIARQLGVILPPGELIFLTRKYSKVAVGAFVARLERSGRSITDVGFSYYENETFFHRNHIRDNRSCTLSDSDRKYLASFLAAPEFRFLRG
jgi:hypothetical protein